NLPSILVAGDTYYAYIDIVVQNKGETPALNATISEIIPNQINITIRDEYGNWTNATVNITVTCPPGWNQTNVTIYNYYSPWANRTYPVINATNCSTVINVSPHDVIDPVGRINIIVHTPPWLNVTYGCSNNPPCNNDNCTWRNITSYEEDVARSRFPFNLGGELYNNGTVGESNTSKVDYQDVWNRNFTSPLREIGARYAIFGPDFGAFKVTKSMYMVLPDGSISNVVPANGTANVTIEFAIVASECFVRNYTNRSCECGNGENRTAYCYELIPTENATLRYLEDTIPKGVNYRLNVTGISLPPTETISTTFYDIYSWRNLTVPCGQVIKIYINATLEPLGTEGEITVNKGGTYIYYNGTLHRDVVELLPIDTVTSKISNFSITKGTHPSLLPAAGGKHVYHLIEIYDSPELHWFPNPYYHSFGFRNGTVRTYTGGTLPYQTITYSSIVNNVNNFTIIQLTFSNTGNVTWNITSLSIANITMRHNPDPSQTFTNNFNITPNFNTPIIVNPAEYVIVYFNVTYNGSVPTQQIYEVNFKWTAENVPDGFSIAPARIGVGNSSIREYYDYGRDIIISDKLRSGVQYLSSRYIHGPCPEVVNESIYNSAKPFNYTTIIGNASTGTNITWNLTALHSDWNNTVTVPYVVNDSENFTTQSKFCILVDSLWLGGTTGTYPINLGANVTYVDDTWNETKSAESNVPEADVHGPRINVTKKITDIYTFIPPDNKCQYVYPYDPNRPNFTEKYPRIPYNMTSMVCMMIYVRNDGDTVASNVTVVDVLPPNSTYISNDLGYQGCPQSPRNSYRLQPNNVSNNTPSANYTTLNWTITDVAPGGISYILVCVNVTPNETNGVDPGANITINEPVNASYMSDLFPGDRFNTSNYEELNASSNETVLQINKTASHNFLNATVPTLINLTINVTNIGYVMADHVYIMDDIPLYNSTYQMSANVTCVKIYLQNSSGIYESNNTCDEGYGIIGHIPNVPNREDVNYTYYGYYTGNPGQDGYNYTLKYQFLSNLSVNASFIINVTLNITVNLSAEALRLNYNPLAWADNAVLKEGPPVEVNITVGGPRLNITKNVTRICIPPIDKTCVAECSGGDGSSWDNAKCLISQDNATENSTSESINIGTTTYAYYYKYVLDGWSYINITTNGTGVGLSIGLYANWNGSNDTFDCVNV
ncbi:MAG: hypothetical protein ACK4YO_01410, partial [Candidatus Altarchaeaceae archaeon]